VEGCGYMRGFRQVVHGIFAHSRPVKTGTPRLLPLDIYRHFVGLSAKETAQMPSLTCLNWFDFEGE
jgi:hypothetical protein